MHLIAFVVLSFLVLSIAKLQNDAKRVFPNKLHS